MEDSVVDSHCYRRKHWDVGGVCVLRVHAHRREQTKTGYGHTELSL